jgi:hypothetical protein
MRLPGEQLPSAGRRHTIPVWRAEIGRGAVLLKSFPASNISREGSFDRKQTEPSRYDNVTVTHGFDFANYPW